MYATIRAVTANQSMGAKIVRSTRIHKPDEALITLDLDGALTYAGPSEPALLWLGMQFALLGFTSLDEILDGCCCLRVHHLRCELTVSFKLGVDLDALLAHFQSCICALDTLSVRPTAGLVHLDERHALDFRVVPESHRRLYQEGQR
jgi:hypothetical protein